MQGVWTSCVVQGADEEVSEGWTILFLLAFLVASGFGYGYCSLSLGGCGWAFIFVLSDTALFDCFLEPFSGEADVFSSSETGRGIHTVCLLLSLGRPFMKPKSRY